MDADAADALDGRVGDGQGTPLLALDGFTGPLERLLTLARTQRIDLARLPLGDLLDQLAAALQHAPPATPLGRKGDWVVMTAWLVQLRSLLLLPVDHPAQRAAEAEADQLRERLVSLRAMQALASWLDGRPQLGRDVFAGGQPELVGTTVETAPAVDAVEFLWAAMALFDDAADVAETGSRCRPPWSDLHSVPEARDRILRLLGETPGGGPLDRFLPAAPGETETALRRRSAWTTTFAASLELAKQGDAVVAQDGLFLPIQLSRAAAGAAADANGAAVELR
jgi:segregation and condensation protein A